VCDGVATVEGFGKQRGVHEAGLREPDPGPLSDGGVAAVGATGDEDNLVTGRDQLSRQVPSHKSGAPRDRKPHNATCPAAALASATLLR
jgi:hypothetical protein